MSYPVLRFNKNRTTENLEDKGKLAIIEQRKSLCAYANQNDAGRGWLVPHNFLFFRVHVIIDKSVEPNTAEVFYSLEAFMRGNPQVKNFNTLSYAEAEVKYSEYEALIKACSNDVELSQNKQKS